MDVLRKPGMASLVVCAFAIGVVMNSALAFVPLAIRTDAGGLNKSLALLPMLVAAGIGTIAGGVTPDASTGKIGVVAWLGVAVSFTWLLIDGTLMRVKPSALVTGLIAIPAGFGMGYLWPTLLGRSQQGSARKNLSSLGGAIQVSRNFGGSTALAILGVPAADPAGFKGGLGLAFVILTVCACAGAFLWLRVKQTVTGDKGVANDNHLA
jgi:hypothetical protein